MLRAHSIRPTLFTAVLVLASLVSSSYAGLARGDPAVNDNGNGTKTATWDFTNPANYTLSNIAMGPNDATLRSSPGGWIQSSNPDFVGNGTSDPATRVTNGSIQLAG